MMNEVDGMKPEDYSKERVMHNGMSGLWSLYCPVPINTLLLHSRTA